MKVTNDINKSAFEMIEYIKEITSRTVMEAVNRGDVKTDRQSMMKLIAIVNSTIEKGFHDCNREFTQKMTKIIDSHVNSLQAPLKKK